jgi:hypothetical protein
LSSRALFAGLSDIDFHRKLINHFGMAKGGVRPGAGRPCGPSKATIEKSLVAARAVADAKAAGRKLAKEVLEDFMIVTAGMAAHFQPTPAGSPRNPYADEAKFWKCAEAAIDCAHKLAPYQSPTLRAVTVMAPSLNERPLPRQYEGTDDPVALSRIYQRMIKQVRG